MALKTFGARLRQLRRQKSADEERDVLASEVYKAVGITQPNFSRYELADYEPSDVKDVKALATFYKVSWIWLLHGEGQRELPSTTEEERPRPASTARAAAGGGKRPPRKR